jgi:hypothetical protein
MRCPRPRRISKSSDSPRFATHGDIAFPAVSAGLRRVSKSPSRRVSKGRDDDFWCHRSFSFAPNSQSLRQGQHRRARSSHHLSDSENFETQRLILNHDPYPPLSRNLFLQTVSAGVHAGGVADGSQGLSAKARYPWKMVEGKPTPAGVGDSRLAGGMLRGPSRAENRAVV